MKKSYVPFNQSIRLVPCNFPLSYWPLIKTPDRRERQQQKIPCFLPRCLPEGKALHRRRYSGVLDLNWFSSRRRHGAGDSVSGRAKPASDGRAKTGHFEEREICPLPLAFGSRRKRIVRWQINSRWPKYKRFWHLRKAAGPAGTLPGISAFTARRSDAIFACFPKTIQNRPARPSTTFGNSPTKQFQDKSI